MLQLLDATLEALLREEVPLPASDIEIAFQAPDRDWGAGINKPTVNLYLWDLRRNDDERASGWELTEDENGRPVRTAPRPRVDCRYLVTAWTQEVLDEHALLGQVMATLLSRPRIPDRYLQGVLAEIEPRPTLDLAFEDAANRSEMWSALDGQLKPALDVVVTITVDSVLSKDVGPPVERYTLGVRAGQGADDELSERTLVGGRAAGDQVELVVGPRGSGRVGADGTFVVPAEAGEQVHAVPGGDEYEVPEDGAVEID